MDTKKIATRDAFGEEIIAQGLANPNIYVIDADIGKSCKTTNFMKQLPEQHLNVGIAEPSAVAEAAGLATTENPICCHIRCICLLRACEVMRQEACYPNLNVKIACSTAV